MKFPALKDAEGKLQAKRDELAGIFAEAQAGDEGTIDLSKVKAFNGDTSAAAAAIKALNDELTDLSKEADKLRAVQAAAAAATDDDPGIEPGDTRPAGRRAKSFGELFIESPAFKARAGKNGPEATLDISLNALLRPQAALFETGTGWTPETTRGPRIVEDEQRPLQVAQLIPQTTTGQSSVTFMEETTFTNAAAETAEGGIKPEAALGLTERTSPVRKIAVWIPVTDEQLEDEPRVRDYLNNRLPFMVRQRLDAQIISGDGLAPNLRGLLNVAGIQTQAKGTDPTPDAVYKAITKVEVTGQAVPDAVVFHPNDWQEVRLLRTADGIYVWGNPSEAGPERIWGLRVAKAQAATEGTAVVGDFQNFSELAVRSGMDVQVSNSHSTFFVENKQAVRAEIRAAFVVYRPTAFCTVTGV